MVENVNENTKKIDELDLKSKEQDKTIKLIRNNANELEKNQANILEQLEELKDKDKKNKEELDKLKSIVEKNKKDIALKNEEDETLIINKVADQDHFRESCQGVEEPNSIHQDRPEIREGNFHQSSKGKEPSS